ncbi:MAG: hypothetical protein J2P15_00950 [Micromonosporaceae bacterium]|nr:hypothetical protein [Micromonosporaceae bacterium]
MAAPNLLNQTVVRREALRRWLLVGAATAVAAGTPVALRAIPTRVRDIPPDQLFQLVRGSARQPYQGFALSTGTAGLPALPQLTSVSRLLSGQTQLRAWYAAPDRWRVDTLNEGDEHGLYAGPDGQQTLWDYGANQITEVTGTAPVRLPRAADLVPPDLGRRLLGDARPPTDRLTALPAKRIASISAPGLRVTPSDPQSTLGRVDLWADPATGLPLQVEVAAKGVPTPVLSTRFLDLARTAPDPAVLVPPPVRTGVGFTVTNAPDLGGALSNLGLGQLPHRLAGRCRTGGTALTGAGQYGTGFASFVVLAVPRNTGFDMMRTMLHAGGVALDLPRGDAVLLATGLLSVMGVDSHAVRRTYLLAGLVGGDLLHQAGTDLDAFWAGRPA